MSIANMGVTMHNLIVRMQLNGELRDEVGGEDLIAEILNDDEQATNEAENEYKEN